MASMPGMAERSIIINSVSKTYSATGWRVGWVIAPKPVTAAIRKVHDFLTVGAPCPLQEATLAALELPLSYYDGLRQRYDQGRRFLYEVLEEQGFEPNLPRGAYYIITQPQDLMRELKCDDDHAFALRLIELTGVATVPGSSFYSQPHMGKDQVRFCFCKKPETLEAAAQGLRKLGRAGA
jgi:aspartate/methionine/tyrosine aminotransferase